MKQFVDDFKFMEPECPRLINVRLQPKDRRPSFAAFVRPPAGSNNNPTYIKPVQPFQPCLQKQPS
jgi:hypothetical protein